MIKRIFEQVVVAISSKSAPAEDDSARQKGIRLATAVLMLDVARADHVFDETEFDEVLELVEKHISVFLPTTPPSSSTKRTTKQKNLTSLHEFTQLLHNNLDEDEKSRIVEMLWKIAYADGRLDKYEDSLVLKISDLLHVSRGQVS